jgi:hypothetical protein
LSTRYYWVYTFSWWVQLINNTFNTAYADLQAQFNAWWVAQGGVAPAPALTTKAPYMEYDANSGKFSLYGDAFGYGTTDRTSLGGSPDERFTLFFNSNLYNMFSGFENIFVGLPNNRTNSITFKNKLQQNVVTVTKALPFTPVGTTYYYVNEQDYISTSTEWSPISAIVFASTLMPSVNEQTTEPIRIGQNNNATLTTPASFAPIITDIVLALDSPGATYRDNILYTPTAEYRITAFENNHTDLKNIDISVFWRCKYNNALFPVSLPNLGTCSLKILFRRKRF